MERGDGWMAAEKRGTSRGKKTPLCGKEKRRLRQLAACLLLFGVVFAGRGVDLGPVSRLSSRVVETVQTDMDFQEVFARVGESFSWGEPAVETFRSLWAGAFSPQEETEQEGEDGENEPDTGA